MFTVITRWVFTSAMLFGTYLETGIFTTISLALIWVGLELLIVRVMDREKMKRW